MTALNSILPNLEIFTTSLQRSL